jgi:hypothetical protein
MSDPNKRKPLEYWLKDHPAVIGVLMLLVVISVAMGWMDGWFAIVLLAVGTYSIVRTMQKNKTDDT